MKKHLQTFLALFIVAILANVGYRSINPSHALTGSVTAQSVSLPSINSSSVSSFIASQGVNIHTSYGQSPYASEANIANALSTLHISNVRDNISLAGSPSEASTIRQLQSNKVSFDFVVGPVINANFPDPASSLISAITSGGLNPASAPITVEGGNEADNGKDASWVADDQALQSRLYNLAQGISNTSVVGPSLVGIYDGSKPPRNDAQSLGNLSGELNFGNIHAYPNAGNTPEDTINLHKNSELSYVSPGKTVWATETGYNDCGDGNSYPCGASPPASVSASDQAILDPRLLLAGYQNGIGKTFIYELFDEASESAGSSTFQDDWGLYNNNLTLKPSGQSIANMNSILLQNMTGNASQTSFNYQVSGGSKLEQLLLSKHTSSGDHYELILWQDSLPGSPSSPVTISFAGAENVTAYNPSSSSVPFGSYQGTSTISNLSISPAVTILDITAAPPATPTTTPATTPTTSGNATTSSGSNSTSSTSTGSKSGTISNPINLSSLGAPNQPIKTSSVTLTPQTNVPLSQIKKVSYYVNGRLIATVDQSPFTYDLTKANVGSGCNKVKTVVYATDGSTTSTTRQLCIAFTSSDKTQKQLALTISCIVIMIFISLEFLPVWPNHRHLISRSSERLWHKYFTGENITIEPITVAPINQYATGPTSTSQTSKPGNIYTPKDEIK